MSDRPPSAIVRSRIEHQRRLSLIWAIPVITLIIGVWLAWQTISERGPLITVIFETAEGLSAGQSHVRHKDVEMGVVKGIALTPGPQARASHYPDEQGGHAAADRRRAVLGGTAAVFRRRSISGLQTLISGSYIDLLPAAPGASAKRDFVGLENPPVLQSDVPGRTFLLEANRIGSLNLGSPVMFRDLEVGEVLGWEVGEMARNVIIHVFVREPFNKYVHDNSVFWNASGATVQLGPMA